MAGILNSSRLKLERARHHFQDAQACIAAWRDSIHQRAAGPFWLDTNYEPEAGYYSVRFSLVQVVPVELSLIIGDCAHNLRSALDHLAWQIVPVMLREDQATARRAGDIAFPITRGAGHWRSLVGTKAPGISTKQKAILRSHQPFNVSEAVRERHPLALLNRINNTDKHQITVVTVVRVQDELRIDNIFMTHGGFIPNKIEMLDGGTGLIAKDGVEVARIHGITIVGQEMPHLGVTSESDSFIGFEDGYPVLDGLNLMLKEVEIIISEIEGAM